nr:MAG TPA: hypothetical protein [Bacteriophage sp.]
MYNIFFLDFILSKTSKNIDKSIKKTYNCYVLNF